MSVSVLQHTAPLMFYCWRSSVWHSGGRPVQVWTGFCALGDSFKLSLHFLHVNMTISPPLGEGVLMVLNHKVSMAWF